MYSLATRRRDHKTWDDLLNRSGFEAVMQSIAPSPRYSAEGTVCFVLDRPTHRLLLGLKKRGVGVGKYNGFGGKLEPGETAREAAARELWEESGLTVIPDFLQPMGHVFFPHVQQRMHLFVVTEWQGTPKESEEMMPQWFPLTTIPYSQMWPTDAAWLPVVLDGKPIQVIVHRQPDGQRVCELIKTAPWQNRF